MNSSVFIFSCFALLSVFIFSNVCAYKFGKYQGWMEIFRKYAQYEKEDITLKAGETFVAVVDMKKSQYLFIGNDAKKGSNYE